MRAFGVTDRGAVRSENQDSYRIVERSDKLLLVVCDGMGGAKGGAIASALACDTFTAYCEQNFRSQSGMQRVLLQAVEEANRAVYERAQTDPMCSGMGTTLAALCIWGREVCAVNVGDSRVYAVDESGIRCLTTDHSVVEWMVQRGELSSEQAKHYPGKNMITRAVGTDEIVECDAFSSRRTPGDAYLLCSDGLSNLLGDQELLFEIVHGGEPETCCQRLLDIAMNRGAADNVTAILACD
ncbi:MAG: Stp1/IreP family PP2C-type Ser/Thr phosphatase [Oscillospiraceae bacterium]|nr:Stp1/IreP family PP2C-type Ser/Thr phosphatase [Oscillospiraceae bacterium]